MIGVDLRNAACDSPAEGAMLGLLGLMTGISEEAYFAGWMSYLEYDLWFAKGGDCYGRFYFSERQITLLKLLSAECDGWWHWDDNSGQPKFISLTEWKEIAFRWPQSKTRLSAPRLGSA